MATLQASNVISSSLASQRKIKATLHNPIPKFPVRDFVEELNRQNGFQTMTTTSTQIQMMRPRISTNTRNNEETSNLKVLSELYAIMETVADRAEMHKKIGEQRDNWNHLLLTSINGITATAATMAGIAGVCGVGASLLALKLSSTLLYTGATGILVLMNKIQPSQLAEEQRNASRLFKQLHEQIKTTLALRNPTSMDVKDAMEKVLALDKAYPLPLLGAMIDKFPETVEPAVWWPQQLKSKHETVGSKVEKNGWSEKLEEEVREVDEVLKRKDTAEYVRLSKVVLKINKILAICGPLLTGLAGVGSAFVGSPLLGSWALLLGVMFGALATVVNTLEHGGQLGMVFEMYRSSAGFFRLMEETIESTLKEKEAEEREDGELFEVKVALQLGRSLSGLRDLASHASSSSSGNGEATEEFASKLF